METASVRRLPLYGDCLCTETASVRRLPLYGDCLCTETVSVRRLPLYGDCLCTETASVRRLPLYGDCLYTETASVRKLPLYGNCLCIVDTCTESPSVPNGEGPLLRHTCTDPKVSLIERVIKYVLYVYIYKPVCVHFHTYVLTPLYCVCAHRCSVLHNVL